MSNFVPLSLSALLLLTVTGCRKNYEDYIKLGDEHYHAKRHKEAILNYRAALQKDAGAGEAYQKLGLALLDDGQIADAYMTLNRAAGMLPKQVEVRVKLGEIAMAALMTDPSRPKAFYEKLTAVSDELLAMKSDDHQGLRFKGHLAQFDNKSAAEVLDWFRKANRSKPLQSEVVVPLLPLLFNNNVAEEGEKLALDFLAKPENKTYGPVYELLYAHYFRNKRIDEAESLLKRRIANSPTDPRAIVLLALHYTQLERKADADAALQPLINDAKHYPAGIISASEFYVGRNDFDTATRLLLRGIQQNASNPLPYQQKLVGIKMRQRRFGEALNIVEDVLRRDPDSQDAKTVRAKIRLASNDPIMIRMALDTYKDVVMGAPRDVDLRIQAARAFQRFGNITSAQTELREALKIAPNNPEPLVLLGEIAYDQNDPQQSLQYADQALSINADLASAKMLRIISLSRTGQFARADEEMTQLARRYPGNAEIRIQTGRIRLDQGRYAEAQAIFQALYQRKTPDIRVLRGLAESYIGQKKPDQAVGLLEGELNDSPIRERLRPLLAVTQVLAGKPNDAITQIKAAVANDPKSTALHIQLAQLNQSQGKIEDAISSYQKAAEVAGDDPKLKIPLIGNVAYLRQSMGQTQQAREAYNQILQIDPDNATALNNQAYLLTETNGSLDTAQAMIERARKRNSKNPEYDDTLAWIYTKKNQTDSAIPIFQRLVRDNPKSARFRYHLGAALLQKGDNTRARQELEAALAANPANAERAQIENLLQRAGR